MTLEGLVPPLKLCKQIPKGKFADSALVWRGTNHLWWDYYTMPRECGNCRELDPGEIIAPAPTLQEILSVIPVNMMADFYIAQNEKGTYTIDITVNNTSAEIANDDSPATAALKLWLEVNKPDRTDRTDRKEEETDETDENRGTEN